ncbi:MAG TPA: hypothetical protein VM680_18435 [Verrucomicrobiae bacterium]|nr:hypothetical protein [Verrucomicrobiae bacterium]
MDSQFQALLRDLRAVLDRYQLKADLVAAVAPRPALEPREIMETVTGYIANDFNMEPVELTNRYGPNDERQDVRRLAAVLAHRFLTLNNVRLAHRIVARFFGIADNHFIVRSRNRLKDLMATDQSLAARFERLQSELNSVFKIGHENKTPATRFQTANQLAAELQQRSFHPVANPFPRSKTQSSVLSPRNSN